MNIVIGIDPDSEKHGVATYVNGKLKTLETATLMCLISKVEAVKATKEITSLRFAIEDVCSNNFIYTRNIKTNPKIQSTVARSVGACQQSQRELMRMLDVFEVPYILYKPTGSNWAKNKTRFENVTGWSKRSNEDTRSAAYFGFIGSKS